MAKSDDKPKVVLVGSDGRPSGVPRHILHLVRALQDHTNLIVISDQDEGGYTPLQKMGVRHEQITGLKNRLSLSHIYHGQRDLLRLFQDTKPDLIWIHARLPILLTRILLALRIWRPDCPVAYTHHGLPYGRGYHPLVHTICKRVEKLLVATCPSQHLIFLNHRMAGWMARDTKAARMARHRVHILPNCSDLRPFPRKKDPNRRHLVMTGRTGRQKDYDFAVRLLAKLPSHYHLSLCGPGTNDPAFQTKIARLVPQDVLDRITFTGPLSDVRKPLQQADAYLLTSRYEGTPIGALEAFEAGLPIILRDFDGANDLISKHPCGLLIGQGDWETDLQEIDALLERFDAAPTEIGRQIRQVWEQNWSPDIFAANAQALVRAISPRLTAPQAGPDCKRDVQAPHPDPHKIPDAPAPTLRPYCTGVLPSVGNG